MKRTQIRTHFNWRAGETDPTYITLEYTLEEQRAFVQEMAQTFKEQINRTNLRQVLNIEAMKTGLAAINKKGTTYKFYEQAMLADPKTSANDLAISFYKLAKGHGMGRYLKKYITKT